MTPRPTGTPGRVLGAGAALTALALTLAACGSSVGDAGTSGAGSSGSSSAASKITVRATTSSCTASASSLHSGRHTFSIKNAGSDVTEFYVYAAGDRSVGEVENIGPAISRSLTVDLAPGAYELTCKPGMTGRGIRSALTVTGAAPSPQTLDAELTGAVASYRRYVTTQAGALLATTRPFVAAVKAGQLATAKQLYAAARLRYETIEPIAESFGDLDPLIDMRADDVTAAAPFVGFHRLESDLWKTKDISASGPTADALLADVRKLVALIPGVEITPLTMANGAKSLLDEVAKSKVTGEEERYSRIDLVDFSANVEGARTVFTSLRPALVQRDPALVATLDARFRSLQDLLDTHAGVRGRPGFVPGSGYVAYDVLTPAEVKALAVEVDAISEPLGRIPAAVSTR